ncbi:hypothetical protein [Kutzneria sp. 744]|uniref:hypothetical protein n=1 Tax=Kutzneria sp. (strain 744) TaxID=345341 RepID=UPI0003EECE66|nr:hypothetical protein [Kutzneria sp. 744]EWM19620.1 hypothetical protein KUTG_09924 [Kutzneria sp. 744]
MDRFDAANAEDAEAHARNSLAHRTTDWHDDSSVYGAAVYLEFGPRCATTHRGPDELYHRAAWERAAIAALNAGREDWQRWASQHHKEFAIRRPTDEEVRAALSAMR